MKLALFTLLFVLGAVVAQNCDLEGPFICSGGSILGIDFGDDEDDDFFEYYTSSGTTTDGSARCTVVQQGTYEVDDDTISVEFEIDDDECVIAGENQSGCDCVDDLEFTTDSTCGVITGPNGETCTPSDS